jgi:hypothetical protein
MHSSRRLRRALLMGPDGGFIMGSDFLMDGGVTAAYWYGELAPRDERSAETSITSQNQTMTLSIRDVRFTLESGHRSVGLA